MTTQRTSEIAVRLALGASRADVIGLVQRECLQLVAAGVLIGIPAAFGAMRLVTMQLPNLRPVSPPVVGLVVALITGVGLLAGLIPALRAARVDPMRALRVE
jgi:ABC-type antimicrobial peptide transport system permease subunit